MHPGTDLRSKSKDREPRRAARMLVTSILETTACKPLSDDLVQKGDRLESLPLLCHRIHILEPEESPSVLRHLATSCPGCQLGDAKHRIDRSMRFV